MMPRRRWLATLSLLPAAAATLSIAKSAAADGSHGTIRPPLTADAYLAQVALLLDETRRAQDWLGSHPDDAGLVDLALPLAQLRSDLAAKISTPTALRGPHMHLLLVLENTTAAFDARARGDAKTSAQRLSVARTEEQTLLLALDGAKVKLPAIK